MSYAGDRAWSDRFLPRVCEIVGPFLLAPAPLDRDRNEATDLIVLRARDMTIGVRLRRPGYAGQYPGQFTIRSGRASGMKTELAKIIEGWGDWLFYGHTDEFGGIPEWMLIDLHKLRAAFICKPHLLHPPHRQSSGRRSNGDGTDFFWFHAPSIHPSLLVGATVATADFARAA